MGCSSNRSTVDNICVVRQIFEKCCEYNIDLHNIFIDCIQVFESVYRNKIIDCSSQYEVPTKLIKLIVLTLTSTAAKVRVNNKFSEEFGVR
jgi:hypothetical protein